MKLFVYIFFYLRHHTRFDTTKKNDRRQVIMETCGSFNLHWPESDNEDDQELVQNSEMLFKEATADVNLEDLFYDEMTEEIMTEPTDTVTAVAAQPASRFSIVSEEDLLEIEKQRHSKSTLKNTKWALKMFNGNYTSLFFLSFKQN